ncbi:MAG: tRNA pseudouridine synthase A, partial [Alphaproteobacteria bacterium]|nr:tRNA pseudouridine synthase A [Alphaproteobacteria bacterium]
MPRYQLIIEYDGTPYAGWQFQEDRPSVQGELERALECFCGEKLTVHGAGRTDAGVHATAQAAHIELPKEMPPYNIMQGLNFHLFNRRDAEGNFQPFHENRIAVIRATAVPEEFHARFSATRRHYLYRIINRRARLGLE